MRVSRFGHRGDADVVDRLFRSHGVSGAISEITGSSISFFVVTAICSIAIVLMLKSAFDVAMHARIRNLGIYKSIGATDAQVRRLLLAEGCVLALPAGCVGVFVGLGSAFLLVSGLVAMTAVNRTYDPVIEIAPAAILTALVASGLTIVISALLPRVDWASSAR